MKKLIIFADYGLDDAAATAHIFKNRERFESITIVPIGGNVPTDVSYRNCITLLNRLDAMDVTVVDTRNILQPFENLTDIHGGDGMGDIFEAVYNECGLNITEFYDWEKTLCGDEVILSLGPMTLVKPILEKHKNPELIIMGGCIDEKPNYKGYEFNHGLDPESFAFCVKYPHVAATLDTCSVKALNMHSYEITGDDVYSKTLNASKRLSAKRQEKGCYVYDDIAACYLFHPERFKTEKRTDPFGNQVTNGIYVSDIPQYID
ncbi:MAG: nucleoside hydrolase [Clostridia bacterium]|nr:nucleoside hydrolase [Clostridia bacterium]